MKTILISGGAGYLGTVLTQSLLKKYKVVVYDTFYFKWLVKNKKKIKNYKNLKLLKKNITDVKISDFENIDIVCDLNGIPNDPSSELNKKYTWLINYGGRKKFAILAKKAGVKRYIFNSTCAVYGHNDRLAKENTKKNPLSTYAKANLKAETSIYKMRSKSFKVNILRNSTLFGFSPNLRLDLVINIFVYSFIKNKFITINGDGMQWRPFISVNDITKIYHTILGNDKLPSFIMNLATFNMKIKDLAQKVVKYFKGKQHNIKFNNINFDNRNYKVGSENFKKYIKNFKPTLLNKELKLLSEGIKKNKLTYDATTVRMKFYKKKFSL